MSIHMFIHMPIHMSIHSSPGCLGGGSATWLHAAAATSAACVRKHECRHAHTPVAHMCNRHGAQTGRQNAGIGVCAHFFCEKGGTDRRPALQTAASTESRAAPSVRRSAASDGVAGGAGGPFVAPPSRPTVSRSVRSPSETCLRALPTVHCPSLESSSLRRVPTCPSISMHMPAMAPGVRHGGGYGRNA